MDNVMRSFLFVITLLLAYDACAAQWDYDSEVVNNSSLQKGQHQATQEQLLASEVAQLLKQEEITWNKHDLSGYLNVFWHSPKFIAIGNLFTKIGYDDFLKNTLSDYGNHLDLMGRVEVASTKIHIIDNRTAVSVINETYIQGLDKFVCHDIATVQLINGEWKITMDTVNVQTQ
jgi:hypothetical protein